MNHFNRSFQRIGYGVMVLAIIASLILPLLGTQVALAQDLPPEVIPAEPTADGPPVRGTIYSATGFVSYPAAARFNSASTLTIEAWVNPFFRGDCETILDNGAPMSYWFGICKEPASDLARLRFSRGNTGFVESSTNFHFFNWMHVAVTYDNANAAFYINGIPAGGGPLAPVDLVEGGLAIGGNGAALYLQGRLDEVRLWSVARTQTQIREGIYRELRSGTGLQATFGDGGLHEDLQALTGAAGAGTGATSEGVLPKDLVAPLAGTTPNLNGFVDENTEWAGAERMVIRLVRTDGAFVDQGQLGSRSVYAYLLRTPTDLYIGIKSAVLFNSSTTEDPWLGEQSKIAVLLDPQYLRPETVETQQDRVLVALNSTDPVNSLWQEGNGSGGFADCSGSGCPVFGTDWDAKLMRYSTSELSPFSTDVEIRISMAMLGTTEEVDGFALAQIDTTVADNHYIAPTGALMSAPDTWATLQYGESTASIPRVKVKGTVLNFLAPGTPGLVGAKVTFGTSGGVTYEQTTDANGRYEFDQFMPFDRPMHLTVADCTDCRFATPTASLLGIKPVVLGNVVSFNGCVQAECQLADIVLKVKLPPGPVSFNGTQTRPMARLIVNTTTNQTTSATKAFISGTNLHEDTSFFLSPMPVLQGPQFDPSEWILFPATVVTRSADMKTVAVNMPTLPKLTKSFNSSVNQGESLAMDWRWVVMDNWPRGLNQNPPVWVDKRASPTFRLVQPLYPEIWGLGFVNEATGSSFTEFTSVYGNNAYICIGLFGACATHIPDPLYDTVFYGIYRGIISQTGGSCVGMSATSSQFASGKLVSTNFDPAASFPAGITVRPDADYDHDSTLDLLTGPARPANLWATVRTNHGKQVSSAVWRMSAEQLIDSAQDGFMEMQVQRAASNQVVLSMKDPDATFGGHAVTPYAVTDFDADTKRVKVYNNNDPLATGPFVDFNFNDDTFKFSGYTNSGGTIFVYPVSEWNGDATFPADIPGMIGNVIFGDAGDASAATQDGSAPTPQNTTQALITTSQGQYGYLPNGTFVNTLPGVAPVPQIGGGMLFPPVLIPENAPNPTITINANTERYFYMAGGGETVLGLRGSNATPGIHDQIALTSTATALTGFAITPQISSTVLLPQIGMNLGPQERLLIRPWGLDVEGGTTAGFTVLPEEHGILYANGSSKASEHYMIVDAVDGAAEAAGTRIFGPMEVPPGADQRITVADWPVARSLKVETDADGDGTYEKVEMFGGRSCGSADGDDNGVPDACQTGQNVYMPVIAR